VPRYLALLLLCASAAQADGDLEQLIDWMSGDYSNAAQFAEEMLVNPEQPRFINLRMMRRPVAIPALGEHLVYGHLSRAEQADTAYRRNIFAFAVDGAGRITMSAWQFRDADAAEGVEQRLASLAGASAEDFVPALPDGCTMYWQREPERFVGRISADSCRVVAARSGVPRGIQATEIVSAARIQTEESGFADDGTMLFGLPDEVYYEFLPLH